MKQRKEGWISTAGPPKNKALTFQFLFLQNYPNSLQF